MRNLSFEETRGLVAALFPDRPVRTLSGGVIRIGQHGSLAVTAPPGIWRDFEAGAAGGMLDLIRHAGKARTRAEAAAFLDRLGLGDEGRPAPRALAPPAPVDPGRIAHARAIWAEAEPIRKGSLAARYLERRGLAGPYPRALAFHPACWNPETKRKLPALIAACTRLEAPGEIVAIQRTWLAEPGVKAALTAPRMNLGATAGACVALREVKRDLIIAEGVESALSASRIHDCPAVAALGVANLASFGVPAGVERVLIAADRDEAGDRAAVDLKARVIAAGCVPARLRPPPGAKDWNDVLMNRMQEAAHV